MPKIEVDYEREVATEEALRALEMMETFTVQIAVTARVRADTEVEAVNLEAAIAKVSAWTHELNDLDYQMTDNEFDGDEIAYIVAENGEQVDLVLKDDGEPFSWDAVAIVKELASLDTDSSDIIDKVLEIISKARRACGKDK